MSGEDRHTIYDIKRIPTGGWPNGLAVDYEERRLYWIDARSAGSSRCVGLYMVRDLMFYGDLLVYTF